MFDKKYRVGILLEKNVDKENESTEVIKEHYISFDDFRTTSLMFNWLVSCVSQFEKENEYEKNKQQNLFKTKR